MLGLKKGGDSLERRLALKSIHMMKTVSPILRGGTRGAIRSAKRRLYWLLRDFMILVPARRPRLTPLARELPRALIADRPWQQRKSGNPTGHTARSTAPKAMISKSATKFVRFWDPATLERFKLWGVCGDLNLPSLPTRDPP